MTEAVKINILEMHSSFGYAGGQRNMFTFAKNFDRNIFNVFAAAYLEGGVYEKKLNEIGVETVSGQRDAGKILKFIADNKIDAIHIHRSGGTVAIETEILQGAKKNNPNLIIVEKNIFGKFDPENEKIIDCSFFQSMMHLNERYLPASGLKFDFDRMKVMYNMVDGAEFEKYRLAPQEIMEAKANYGVKPGEFVLGRIGRPDVAKWSDLVLEMAPYLEKLIPDFKFILMGVPESRVKLIKSKPVLARHFIILEPTGDERKVHTFYQVLDVLGHSSKIGECNGNTINEAMFWGKPVITNSTPKKDNGQLEQIEHMVDGIIANWPQTFARAAAFLKNDSEAYKKMSVTARERVAWVNNPASTVRRLEKFLVEKMAKKNEPFNLCASQIYSKIDYYPGKGEILAYRDKYSRMLNENYGDLRLIERAINILVLPRKMFYKTKDLIEHRLFGIWGKKSPRA